LQSIFPRAELGVWFQFLDANGKGLCQADAVVEFDTFVLVVEIKLTQCFAGINELQTLYRPLAEALWGKPTVGLLLCKNLIKDPEDRFITDLLDDRLTKPSPTVWTYQFLP
jgi:hypothetical protein